MDRGAIQQSRDPIGYTKRASRYPRANRIQPPSLKNTPTVQNLHTTRIISSLNGGTSEKTAADLMLEKLTRVETQINLARNTEDIVHKSLITAVVSPSSIFDNIDLLKQLNTVPQVTDALRPAQNFDYILWHERDWSLMIEWAKTIEVYADLSLSNKLALLRHSAITHPSLIQCFYTPDRGPDTIVFPNGAYFDRNPEPGRPAGFQRKKYTMLDSLLKPMREMKIDIKEFAAIKAIFFLNPGADDLSEDVREDISKTRDKITNALYRYLVRKCRNEEAGNRLGQLLLLGIVISTMAVEVKEAVVLADVFKQIPFPPLAKQLLLGIKEEEVFRNEEPTLKM